MIAAPAPFTCHRFPILRAIAIGAGGQRRHTSTGAGNSPETHARHHTASSGSSTPGPALPRRHRLQTRGRGRLGSGSRRPPRRSNPSTASARPPQSRVSTATRDRACGCPGTPGPLYPTGAESPRCSPGLIRHRQDRIRRRQLSGRAPRETVEGRSPVDLRPPENARHHDGRQRPLSTRLPLDTREQPVHTLHAVILQHLCACLGPPHD